MPQTTWSWCSNPGILDPDSMLLTTLLNVLPFQLLEFSSNITSESFLAFFLTKILFLQLFKCSLIHSLIHSILFETYLLSIHYGEYSSRHWKYIHILIYWNSFLSLLLPVDFSKMLILVTPLASCTVPGMQFVLSKCVLQE